MATQRMVAKDRPRKSPVNLRNTGTKIARSQNTAQVRTNTNPAHQVVQTNTSTARVALNTRHPTAQVSTGMDIQVVAVLINTVVQALALNTGTDTVRVVKISTALVVVTAVARTKTGIAPQASIVQALVANTPPHQTNIVIRIGIINISTVPAVIVAPRAVPIPKARKKM